MLNGNFAPAARLLSKTRQSASGSDQAQDLLERASWRVFVDGLAWAMAGSLGACIATAIAIATISDPLRPLIWATVFMILTGLRVLSLKLFASPAVLSRSPTFPRAVLYSGNVASGLVWGIGSLWLITATQQMEVGVILSFCAAGVTAAAVVSFSSVAWGFTCFALPYLGFLVIGLVFGNHDASYAMAFAVLVFAVVLLGISHAMRSRVRNALSLWLVNKQLYRKTAAALAEANRANILATERKRTEMEAKAASDAKTRFLATMSHELRTPLNAIVGFSEAMKHEIYGPLAEKYRSYATHIHESGVVLGDLVGDLLELSRIELGHLALEKSTVSMADVFADVDKMFQQTPYRQLPRVRFNLSPPDLTVEGDRRMIWQILINLVGNAVKFSPQESTVFVEGEREGDQWVRLRVRDTGKGIARGDLDRITDAFVQGGESESLPQSGVGLGLSLVKAFVDLHEGTLQIESRPEAGTTVTVLLPTRGG